MTSALVTDPAIRRCLADAVLWCSRKPVVAFTEESDDIRRRRAMVKESLRLLEQARRRERWRWFARKFYKTRAYQSAMKLLQKAAPDSLATLEHQLRSPDLEPRLKIGDAICETDRANIVAEVLSKRSGLLGSDWDGHSEEQLFARNPGRILVYVPGENMSDGASRYASNGFFDMEDAPPWDTWLHYSERTLLSWVPGVLVPLVQNGIDANAFDCIRWADLTRCE